MSWNILKLLNCKHLFRARSSFALQQNWIKQTKKRECKSCWYRTYKYIVFSFWVCCIAWIIFLGIELISYIWWCMLAAFSGKNTSAIIAANCCSNVHRGKIKDVQYICVAINRWPRRVVLAKFGATNCWWEANARTDGILQFNR